MSEGTIEEEAHGFESGINTTQGTQRQHHHDIID